MQTTFYVTQVPYVMSGVLCVPRFMCAALFPHSYLYQCKWVSFMFSGNAIYENV